MRKEATRAVWISTRLEQFFQDLRFGLRILTRSSGVSATAIVLIALVIGGNTTVFSIAHGILRKPTPGVHADDLATVSWVTADGNVQTFNSYPAYRHFLEHSTTVRPLAAVDFAAAHPDGGQRQLCRQSDARFAELLRHAWRESRSRAGASTRTTCGSTAPRSLVIAHHVWQNTFNGAADVVGRTVSLNGRPATVVGVAEPRFRGAWLAELAQVGCRSRRMRSWLQPNHPSDAVSMIGRRAPGTSLAEAQAEMTTLWSSAAARAAGAQPEAESEARALLGNRGGDSVVAANGDRMFAILSDVTR